MRRGLEYLKTSMGKLIGRVEAYGQAVFAKGWAGFNRELTYTESTQQSTNGKSTILKLYHPHTFIVYHNTQGTLFSQLNYGTAYVT